MLSMEWALAHTMLYYNQKAHDKTSIEQRGQV